MWLRDVLPVAWERPAGGFGGFGGGQAAGSNALQNTWLACGCERCCRLPGKGLREGLEGSGAGKRQARTPLKTDGWGHVAARVVAGCLGKACGKVWCVGGRANGGLERPSEQMVGHVAALPGKGLREGLEGSGAGKRQARTPLKTDGWGMWLQEVLPVAWERPAGGFGGFGGGRWLGHVAARGVASCLGPAGGFGGFGGGQAAGSNPSKHMAGACGCERCWRLPWPADGNSRILSQPHAPAICFWGRSSLQFARPQPSKHFHSRLPA